MADWDGLRHDLEAGVTPPPLDALRARHQARKQRRTIAMACAVVLVGGASGFAVLDRAAQRDKDPATIEALDRVVSDETVLPPRDYSDYVVTDIDFVSDAEGWAIGLRCVGETCDIATFTTTDGGTTWAPPLDVARGVPRRSFRAEDPAGGAARSIRMLTRDLGYAYNPGLYVTTDGARTWRAVPRPNKVLSISAGNGVWITERGCPVGADCDVVVNAADGDRLTPVSVPPTGGAPALVRKGPARDYLLTWAPASFRYTDNRGATWRDGTMPCPDATAVAFSVGGTGTLWVVCTTPGGRRAFQSTTEGRTWQALADPPDEGVVTDLAAYDGRTAYLATQTPGHLYVTTDGGRTWAGAPGTGKAYGYLNVEIPSLAAAYAMGDAGDLWRSVTGQRWQRLALPPGTRPAPPDPPAASPPAPARGLRDGAVTWTGLAFRDQRHGWAVGRRCARTTCQAVLRRTDDGGDTWREVPAPTPTWPPGDPRSQLAALSSVAFAGERTGWLFGPGSYATYDGGATWEEIPDGYTFDVVPAGERVWLVSYEGCASGPCNAFVRSAPTAGDPGHFVDDGHPTEQLRASVAAYGPRHAYLVDAGPARGDERLVYTTDGGEHWRERPAPCPGSRRDLAAYAPTGLWLLCGGRDDEGRQSVLQSSDGGTTWRTHALGGRGTGIGEIVPLSDRVAWRTGAHRGLLVTRDGGATWRGAPNVADPVTALTFADPEHGWLLAGNALWRTTDGATWERLG